MAKITVQNTDINIVKYNDEDYISLTDMARSQLQEHIIFRWLSLKSTIEYLGEWEILYNTDFNCTEFGTIKNADGKYCITLILIVPNSVQLKMQQEATISFSL